MYISVTICFIVFSYIPKTLIHAAKSQEGFSAKGNTFGISSVRFSAWSTDSWKWKNWVGFSPERKLLILRQEWKLMWGLWCRKLALLEWGSCKWYLPSCHYYRWMDMCELVIDYRIPLLPHRYQNLKMKMLQFAYNLCIASCIL